VSTVINVFVSKNPEKFRSSWPTGCFPRKTLFDGVSYFVLSHGMFSMMMMMINNNNNNNNIN
jgi:hypothetical protein